jgi:hypothetical protein
MSTIRLFHIVAVLVVVFICTINVLQVNARTGRKQAKTNIRKQAKTVLGAGSAAENAALKKAVAACVATNNKVNIQSVALGSLHLLEKLEKKGRKRRDLNDDEEESEEQMELREFGDDEEDFEERAVKADISNTLDLASPFTKTLSVAQIKEYDTAYAKFEQASPKVQAHYIRRVTHYANECAHGKKVVIKRAELADNFEVEEY